MTPQEIEEMKKEIVKDLDVIVERFNADMEAWKNRTKSEATFQWYYDGPTGRKKLAKSSVILPVFQTEVTDEQITSVLERVSTEPEIKVEKLV